MDSAWHGDIDSDAESVDSEEEDPLKLVYVSKEPMSPSFNLVYFN